ncbi:PAS domain-containing sensor histidine kinase [Prevotella sp. HUN102]|uniref:sensor histidine kinase n=1 Tax=Prevotella sp. HUN102 TaxID=1392486 RepID=UPI000491FCCA|nr:ATP-binding protein [Prevotella sp. HUN102]
MKTEVIILIVLLLAMAAAYVRLWLHYRRSVRKVSFLFDALDSGDYSFRFPEDTAKGGEWLLNASLNRVKDILQHARDEQIEREKYFELIMDSVETGILVIEKERGVVLRSNQAARDLLRMDVISHVNKIKDLLSGFSTRETHTVLKGRSVRIIGFSDIKGELANQEIDSWVKLIRVLTHEIMNTVTPIISLSDTLLKNSQGEQHDGLSVINQTGKELIQFVENYRKFTHVPAPKPDLFYVRPFLERMASLVHPILTGDVRVELHVEPKDLLVYADEGLISRVVSNILKNAAEAVSLNGRIIIRAYSDEQESVVIDISNDGPRISEEVASHIFVPFFTTKAEGSGIGLSISRQIMRVSNGSLVLLSEKDSALTTFRLVFN